MNKLLATVAAIVVSGAIAYAAYLPPITGPQDPSQLNAALQNLQNNIQTGVNGLIANTVGQVASAATTAEQTLASAVIPGGTLTRNGQTVDLHCAGSSAANTNTKLVKLYFGASSIATASMSTSAETWDLELEATYVTSGQTVYMGRGTTNTTVVAPVSGVNVTDVLTGNLTAKCTTTQGTASAGDTLLNDFIVEQIK